MAPSLASFGTFLLGGNEKSYSKMISLLLEPSRLFVNLSDGFICCLVYMIKLGTLENESTAEVEWRHHPYTHTAKKRKFLSVQ